MICLSTAQRREVTLCNVNYSPEGICHPDRILREYDLLYLLEGSWNIMEQEVCHHVEKGQLLILEPGLHHYSLEKCSPGMRNMYIHCSVLEQDGILEAPDCLCLHKCTDCSDAPQIAGLFRQIIEAYWSREGHTRLRLCALLDLLLAELALPSSQSERAAVTDPLVKEVLHLFYCCTDRFFSPQELADLHRVSVRTLSSRFKKETGASVHQYQLTLKLNLARQQLPLYPGRRLKDVALGLGFYDEFQFSRLFKRQFGHPPSAVSAGNGTTGTPVR